MRLRRCSGQRKRVDEEESRHLPICWATCCNECVGKTTLRILPSLFSSSSTLDPTSGGCEIGLNSVRMDVSTDYGAITYEAKLEYVPVIPMLPSLLATQDASSDCTLTSTSLPSRRVPVKPSPVTHTHTHTHTEREQTNQL